MTEIQISKQVYMLEVEMFPYLIGYNDLNDQALYFGH